MIKTYNDLKKGVVKQAEVEISQPILKEEKDTRRFTLYHPDAVLSRDITCHIKVLEKDVYIDHGMVEIEGKQMYDEFIRMGYLPSKNYFSQKYGDEI